MTIIDIVEYDIYMELLTRKEVAKYFRVHERTIDRWIQSGSLKGYKLGNERKSLWRIPKSEIKEFLERNKVTIKK